MANTAACRRVHVVQTYICNDSSTGASALKTSRSSTLPTSLKEVPRLAAPPIHHKDVQGKAVHRIKRVRLANVEIQVPLRQAAQPSGTLSQHLAHTLLRAPRLITSAAEWLQQPLAHTQQPAAQARVIGSFAVRRALRECQHSCACALCPHTGRRCTAQPTPWCAASAAAGAIIPSTWHKVTSVWAQKVPQSDAPLRPPADARGPNTVQAHTVQSPKQSSD